MRPVSQPISRKIVRNIYSKLLIKTTKIKKKKSILLHYAMWCYVRTLILISGM